MLPGGNAVLLDDVEFDSTGAAGVTGLTDLDLSSILRSEKLRPGSVEDRIKGLIAGGSSSVLESALFPSVSGVLPILFEYGSRSPFFKLPLRY